LLLLDVGFLAVEDFDVEVTCGLACDVACAHTPAAPKIHKPPASISPPAARKIVLVALSKFASNVISMRQPRI